MLKGNFDDTITKLMTVEQGKQRYKVSRATLMRLAEEANAIRRFGRSIRIDAQALDRLVDKLY